MLNNYIFPIYDVESESIIDGSAIKKFSFCSKCINDSAKRCSNYYNKINKDNDTILQCPYGLTTIVKKWNNIYFSVIARKCR